MACKYLEARKLLRVNRNRVILLTVYVLPFRQVSLKCSFVELYQNEVRDLLRKRTDEDLDPKPEVSYMKIKHLISKRRA